MKSLPPAFASLQPYIGWALPTETERNHRRITASQPDITAFAAAMTPRLDAIAAHLNEYPLDALPEASRNLFHMLLSVAEIAPCVEFYQAPTVFEGYDSARFRAQEDSPLRPRA